MGDEVTALAASAAGTLVTLATTDGWSRAKAALQGYWHEHGFRGGKHLGRTLDETRKTALEGSVSRAERDLAQRLTEFLDGDSEAFRRLGLFLDELKQEPTVQPVNKGRINIQAKTSGSGVTFIVGQGEIRNG